MLSSERSEIMTPKSFRTRTSSLEAVFLTRFTLKNLPPTSGGLMNVPAGDSVHAGVKPRTRAWNAAMPAVQSVKTGMTVYPTGPARKAGGAIRSPHVAKSPFAPIVQQTGAIVPGSRAQAQRRSLWTAFEVTLVSYTFG
jgi:hypothetical protein